MITTIDGKQYAKDIKHEIAERICNLLDTGKRAPHLAAIILGTEAASETYISAIEKSCKEVGIISSVYKLPETTSEEELIKTLIFINNDDEIDGYIIQTPLPQHIVMEHIIEHINPDKDIDCFHPYTNGKLILGEPTFPPATAQSVMMLLEREHIETEGKHCVIVGRSNIVGSPLAMMLSRNKKNANATVTLCHSKTQNLTQICQQADILIVAIGKPEYITKEYVKKNAVVIDVGIHRIIDEEKISEFKLCGDVKFDEVAPIASKITPVPGGVGALTIIALLQNVLNAYLRKTHL